MAEQWVSVLVPDRGRRVDHTWLGSQEHSLCALQPL